MFSWSINNRYQTRSQHLLSHWSSESSWETTSKSRKTWEEWADTSTLCTSNTTTKIDSSWWYRNSQSIKSYNSNGPIKNIQITVKKRMITRICHHALLCQLMHNRQWYTRKTLHRLKTTTKMAPSLNIIIALPNQLTAQIYTIFLIKTSL